MIFVDANVFMYAVGGPHEHRRPAQMRLADPSERFVTSAEALQELLHRYTRAQRPEPLEAAWTIARERMDVVDLTFADLHLARRLQGRHPNLSSRDLVHLATCINHRVTGLWTYDCGLAAAWEEY